MTEPLVADEKLVSALSLAKGPFPVCAADGRVIGYVSPTADLARPAIDEGEIRRRFDDPNGRWIPAAVVEAKIRELKCTR